MPSTGSGSDPPERSTRVDVPLLRGLALLGVVVAHATAAFVGTSADCTACVVAAHVDVLAHASVPLFLVASGYALGMRYRECCPPRHFYSRRARALLPPYLLASVGYMLLSPYEGTLPVPFVVAARVLSGTGFYHLWFVVLLLQLYLLFPLLLRLARLLPGRGCLWLGVCVALALQVVYVWLWPCVAPWLLDAGHELPALGAEVATKRLFPAGIGYFVLGLGLSGDAGALRRLRRGWWGVALAAPSAVLTAHIGGLWLRNVAVYGRIDALGYGPMGWGPVLELLLHTAVSLLVIRCVVGWVGDEARPLRGLRWVGRHSYALYLLHAAVLLLVEWGVGMAGLTPCRLLYYPVVMAATLGLSGGVLAVGVVCVWRAGGRESPPRRGPTCFV